jgi:Predicted transcriptional regulators
MENLIRSEREQRGWTQAVLAERLEVSRQTIVALETGKYDPSLPLAFRISRLFEKPIEGLFTPTNNS